MAIFVNRRSLYISLLLIGAFYSGFAYSANQTLKMVHIDFYPFFYQDEEGTSRGEFVTLAHELAKRSNYKISIDQLPFNRMIKSLKSGSADIWIGLKTVPSIMESTIVGDSIVGHITLTAFSTKTLPSIRRKEDLNGKRIIIQRGYSYGGWIHYILNPSNNVTYMYASSHRIALKMLANERADYLLAYSEPTWEIVSSLQIESLYSQIVSKLPCYISVSKKTSNAATVLSDLESAFGELQAGKISQNFD